MSTVTVSCLSAVCGLFVFMTDRPAAWAQPIQGPYIQGSAGIALPSSQPVSQGAGNPPSASGSSAAAAANAAINGKPGAVQSGSAGWGFGNGVRVEVQGMHSQQSLGAGP